MNTHLLITHHSSETEPNLPVTFSSFKPQENIIIQIITHVCVRHLVCHVKCPFK